MLMYVTVVQFCMFMVRMVSLKYLAQMCTREGKKGVLFFKCSLWVYVKSSVYFWNAQKHKSIFCVCFFIFFAIPASTYAYTPAIYCILPDSHRSFSF